jgi:hypothetical protein
MKGNGLELKVMGPIVEAPGQTVVRGRKLHFR